MDILKGFIDIVSNPIKAVGDAVDGAVRNLADDEARRQAEEEERRRREEEERKRREEEKRRAEEEERARRAEEVRRQQEQAEKQRQELQKQANELNNNRQNMSDEEYSMKRQELTLKDNGFNDLQSKLNAEKYSNAKVSDNLKIDGEGEEGRHQFNVGKIAHKLFDGSDADNLSVEQMGKRWSELGGNDQQDIMANLKTLQYRYTQENKAKEAESTARLMVDLERYGGKAKDRDFLNSLVTNAKHGGFAGDIASNIEQTLGNATGQGEKFRKILNARQNDMDSLDGWNKAGNTIGNIVFDTGANLVSGGAKMALDTGIGAINVGEKALDEKTLDGNGKIRNHNLEEQAGLIGSELVTDGLRLAGAKGLTPSLDKVADLMRSGSGIKQILPEVAKYGAKELGTVLPTSYLQTNLNVMGNGGHFGDAKLEDIAKDTAMNIGTDLAMDIRSGLGRARTGGDVKQLYHDGKLLPNTGLTPNAGRNARMAEAIDNYPISEPFNYGRLSKEQVARHNSLNDGLNPLQTRDLTVNPQQFNPHIEKRISQGVNPEDLTKITENAIYGDNSQILSGTTNPLNRRYVNADNPSSVAIIGNDNGETTLRSFYPRKTDNIKSDIAKDTAINSQNMATHLQEMGAINNIPQNSSNVNNSPKYKLSSETEDVSRKQAQFDLLQKTNPMLDDYHTGIRKPEEIKTLQEVIKHHDPDEDFVYPDFELKDAQKAMDNGKITIYSSYPIKEGVFVSPSKMMAQDYAGGREVYSKEVDLKDIGWINGDEGNYLPVNNREDLKFQKQQSINYELANKQDLLSRHLELTGDEKLAFNEWQNAMQKKALGYYNPETDSINLNKLSMDTLNHEIGHKMLTKVANREELLSEIKRAYGEDNLIATYGKLYGTNDLNLLAEEKLADGFTDYYNGIKNGKDIRILGQELRIPPKVLAIYDRIMEAIKGLIGKQDQIKQFYSQMETGKFRQASINENSKPVGEPTYKISRDQQGDFVEVAQNIFKEVPRSERAKVLRKYLQQNLQGQNYKLSYGEDGSAKITKVSTQKISNPQQNPYNLDKKGQMISELPDILTISQKTGWAPDGKDHSFARDGFEYRQSRVKLGDDIYTVNLNVGINSNNKILYEINSIKKESPITGANSSFGSGDSSYDGIITQDSKNIKYLHDSPKKQGIVKNLKIEDGEIKNFIEDQVKKQNDQNKIPLKEKLEDNVANLKHYLIDDAVAYERYTKDKALKKELREGIDRVRSSETIASQFIRDTGLSEALGKMSKQEQNEFSQYLIAKRHLEVADRDIATGRDLNIDKAIVEKFKDKYSQAEEVYRNHNKAMLEHIAEHGLISSELKDKLIAENPNYAPLQRIMDEAESFSGNSKQLGNLSNQSVVKGLKGSERVVDNPLEATLNNTFRMINEVERNKVARSLAENVFGGDNVEVTRDMPNWAKQPNMDRKGIVKGLRLGETERLAYLDNGKKVEIEVPKLVAKEMKNLNGVLPDGLDKVISVLAMPAKTLRAGATGLNPIFVASNLVRDQIQSAVSGGVRSSIGGFDKAFKATFLRGEEADALRAELARSGLGGSEYRMTYGGNKGELLKQLQAEHKWTNGTMEKLRHPINTLADIIGITENFTRAQQYFGTKGDITTKAQASRNNTLNFSRGGSVVKVLNKIIPFLNAGVQGGRQTVNLVKERPVHTGVATAVIGGVILAADAINKSDEKRKELWDRVAESDKKTNIIAFTPDAHYNPETNRIEGLIKIPMPQIFYPLLDLQNAKGTIPEKGLKIASDIFTAVSGIDVDNPISQLTPTAVKPMLEQFTNKNFFTGRELVSDYDKNKRPDEKGAKYSSGIARGIANLTGIDTPVVDNYITGFAGSLGGDMAKTLTDNPDNTKDGKGIVDYIGNGVYRRFLSTNITSQNQIAEDKAKKAKEALNNDPTFKNMSREDQIKVLNAIDNDFSKIASTLSKKEQNREDEAKKDLNDRQKALIDSNFEAGKYAEAMQSGKEGANRDNKYNKKDDKKAFYKKADAEYEDFKKEFAEKSEKGEYSRLQKIEAEHKLKRLKLTKEYDKDVRESYGASKTNLYKLYNILNSEEKENLKGKLNGINDIMLKNGEISQKEYDSKYKIINEIESIKGGRGQKGGVGYVKGLKVEVDKLPEFKMENAPKIKSGESKLNKTTGIVKGLTLNSKTNKEEKVGLKRVRVTIK